VVFYTTQLTKNLEHIIAKREPMISREWVSSKASHW